MRPAQGDIVLVPVPFTDLTSHRRRPVVSNDAYQQATQGLRLRGNDFEPEGRAVQLRDHVRGPGRRDVNRPGRVRADKVFTLAQAIIAARFGRVNQQTIGRIRQVLTRLLS